ncbi:MAG: GNAT family N-acetyltransferase [Halocynthiibacter sp.]
MLTPRDLAALHGACFTTPRAWKADEFQSLIASPLVFLVGDASGFAMGRVIAEDAELLSIAVHPNAQGRGLGRHWLKAFEDTAKTRGATIAFLEVSVKNTSAISLYESEGYCESGLRSGYYRAPNGTRVDARMMQKDLT